MIKFKFYREKEFKETEVGKIPKEWEVKKVKDILKYASSFNGIKEKQIQEEGKYPVIHQGKEFIIGFSNEEKFLIKENLPLIIFGDHTCEVKYIDFPFIVAGEGVKLLKPKDSIYELYFFYTLKNFKPKPQHYRRHFKILKDVYIPLPPLPEQKAIAGVLKEFDDLLEVIEEKIKTLQKIKKGLMEVYFTKGVFEHKEFKDTEIGRIPMEWEVKRLGEVVEIIMGQSPPSSTYNKTGKGMPFLQGSAEFSSIYPKHIKFTTKPLKIAYKGSVLLSVRAPVGDVNIADKNYCIGRGLASIKPIYEINSFYLFYFFKNFRKYLENIGSGSTFKAISKKQLENLPIPLPPLPEQKAIAERLKAIDDQIENLREQKEALQKIKKKFMDLLLTGKVRIKEIKEADSNV